MSLSNAAADDSNSLPAGLKPLAVTIQTAQELIGIKNTKLWELIGVGALETVSVGRRRLVLYPSIKRFLAKLRKKEWDRPRSDRADRAIEASVSARRARKDSRATPGASVEPRSPRSRARRRQPT
jgi:hypothetical protein